MSWIFKNFRNLPKLDLETQSGRSEWTNRLKKDFSKAFSKGWPLNTNTNTNTNKKTNKKTKKTSYVVKYKPNLEDLAGPRTGRLLLKCFPKDLPDLHQCLHCPRENPSHCCEILSLYNKICHIFYVWANYVQSIDYVYADNSWQLVSFLTSELCLLIDVCHSTLCQIPVC